MATLVSGWNSNIGHITDAPDNGEVKTRCGRILKNYHFGHGSFKDCPRCGSPEDYECIREAAAQLYQEERRRQEEETRNRQQQKALRLARHRELMKTLQSLLEDSGAEITDVHQVAAGGHIQFSMNGLNFKLSGSIW